MEERILIRHAPSTANKPGADSSMNAEDLAIANRNAGLTLGKNGEVGRAEEECNALTLELPKYGIDPSAMPVATSKYERTQLTAGLLNFADIRSYYEIDEVDPEMPIDKLRPMLRRNEIPDVAIDAGRLALQYAPTESVWITHGLLIAGICIYLNRIGQYDAVHDRPVPVQCGVRPITFDPTFLPDWRH